MAENRFELLVATRNEGKVRELRDKLTALPVVLRSLAEFPHIGEVAETGTTFAENAAIKASEYARLSGIPSFADDSGLEVDALGGRPGVLSARYGGEDRDYAAKMRMLLDEIASSGSADRSARFVCSVAFALSSGDIAYRAEGVCTGEIAPEPRGEGGFGFDPIFIPSGYGQTFAELPETVKAEISHRARATKIIMRYLPDFIGV